MYNSSQGGKISSYLAKKKLGGEVNQKGNEYELYYACHLICLFANNHPDKVRQILISSQATASIDDLHINFCNSTYHYYQLKTSKYLNWSSRKKHTSAKGISRSLPLKFDFWLQANWCRLNKQKCKLHLVVSEKLVQQQMNLTKPIMMPNVSVDFFAYESTMTKLLYSNAEFRQNITSLCAVSFPTLDILASVANCIIGIWNGSGKRNNSINDLLLKVKSINGSFVKYPLLSNLKISSQLDSILKGINNFHYTIDNDTFVWQYGTTEYGLSPYNITSAEFSEFEQKVIQTNPTSFQVLENLLTILS